MNINLAMQRTTRRLPTIHKAALEMGLGAESKTLSLNYVFKVVAGMKPLENEKLQGTRHDEMQIIMNERVQKTCRGCFQIRHWLTYLTCRRTEKGCCHLDSDVCGKHLSLACHRVTNYRSHWVRFPRTL